MATLHPKYLSYAAFEDGRVVNVPKSRVLAGSRDAKGYYHVGLTLDKRTTSVAVHRFVWECFNGHIPRGMHIDHVNGDKQNNSVANLDLVTPKEHSVRTIKANPTMRKIGGMKRVTAIRRTDPKQLNAIPIDFPSLDEAARQTGVFHENILQAIKNQWRCGGYAWERIVPANMPGEVWACPRQILYRGLEVSNLGRLRRNNGVTSYGTEDGPSYFKTYFNRRNLKVHRIVCETFHGPPPSELHTVDHINRDGRCNAADNLRWATKREQIANRTLLPRKRIRCSPAI